MKIWWKPFFLSVILGILIYMIYYSYQSPLAVTPEVAKTQIQYQQYDAVVDVRTDNEWAMGHYPLALHIPVQSILYDLPMRVPDKQARILFYCNTTVRARKAAETAQRMGYPNVKYLIGSYKTLLE